MMMEVFLSLQEIMTAATVGVRRQVSAMQRDRKQWGVLESSKDYAFDHHIIGAMSELAVAKHFNLFWPDGVGSIHGVDVGGIIEVRCRRLSGTGVDMAMRPKDIEEKPDTPFLLVHEQMPRFRLMGWMFGNAAAGLGDFNEMTGLRYVKPKVLRELEELEKLVISRRFVGVKSEVA